MEFVENLNFILALGTVVMQIGAVILLSAYFFPETLPNARDIRRVVSEWGFVLALLFSLAAAGFALLHENVFGLEPCYWCWWQRIFLFPQIVLFGMALWRSAYRETVCDASIALSILGGGVALYHHALQMFPGAGLPCPATGVSCAQIIFLEFDYITYPLMAFSLFALLIALMLLVRVRRAQ